MKKIVCLSILISTSLLRLLFIPVALGQEQPKQSALGVSPAIVELVLEPGKRKETKVSVFNVTNFPLPIKGSVKSFITNEEIPQEAEEIFDASAWIKLKPADFILQPRERKEIKITIRPPKKAEPGGHYATIYFQPLIPVEVLSPQTAYLAARIGVLAFLIVKGEIIEQASLKDLQTAEFRQFGPVEFKIPFENKGNIHLMPSGEIVVVDFQGRKVAKLTLRSLTVLPKTTRDLKVKWEKKYLLGKFTAQAKVLYGSEHQKLESETIEFWVVPWQPILILIGVLTIGFIVFIIERKRFILALKVLLGKAEVWELKKIQFREEVKRKK